MPAHLDDPELLKWGMSAEQLLQALGGLVLVGLVAGLAILLLPGPFLGWRLVGPLLVAVLFVPVAIGLARWRPDEQLPLAYLLGWLSYRWAPKHADWFPKEDGDVFGVQPPLEEDAAA